MQKLKNTLLLTGLFFVLSCGSAMAADWTIKINEQPIEADVKIVEGRSLVPLRTIGEALGLVVEWHSDTQEVVLDASALLSHKEKNDTVTLNCQNGTYKAFIDNKEKYRMYTAVLKAKDGAIKMLVLPVNIDGQVYVPVRLICDSFGAPVTVADQTITIGQCFTAEGTSMDNVSKLVYTDRQLAEAIVQTIDYSVSAIDKQRAAWGSFEAMGDSEAAAIATAKTIQQQYLSALADWEQANNSCFSCAETKALKDNMTFLINELKRMPTGAITAANYEAFFERFIEVCENSSGYVAATSALIKQIADQIS